MEKLLDAALQYSKFDAGREEASLTCAVCFYWEFLEGGLGGDYGFCRRHAPPAVTISKAAEYEARWPLTDASEWCGEHRQRTPVVAEPRATNT